jgi:DNA-binding HxlR family transcriptional regulator
MSPADATHDARQCDAALAAAFGLLGKRWNGMILGTLATGPLGFSELRRALGAITDSVLSDRLTELTAAKLVSREVTDARPPGVFYTLTTAGRALTPILSEIARWSSEHLPSEKCTETGTC